MGRRRPASSSVFLVPGPLLLRDFAVFLVWANGEGDVLNMNGGVVEKFVLGPLSSPDLFTRGSSWFRLLFISRFMERSVEHISPPNVFLHVIMYLLLYPLTSFFSSTFHVPFDSLCAIHPRV